MVRVKVIGGVKPSAEGVQYTSRVVNLPLDLPAGGELPELYTTRAMAQSLGISGGIGVEYTRFREWVDSNVKVDDEGCLTLFGARVESSMGEVYLPKSILSEQQCAELREINGVEERLTALRRILIRRALRGGAAAIEEVPAADATVETPAVVTVGKTPESVAKLLRQRDRRKSGKTPVEKATAVKLILTEGRGKDAVRVVRTVRLHGLSDESLALARQEGEPLPVFYMQSGLGDEIGVNQKSVSEWRIKGAFEGATRVGKVDDVGVSPFWVIPWQSAQKFREVYPLVGRGTHENNVARTLGVPLDELLAVAREADIGAMMGEVRYFSLPAQHGIREELRKRGIRVNDKPESVSTAPFEELDERSPPSRERKVDAGESLGEKVDSLLRDLFGPVESRSRDDNEHARVVASAFYKLSDNGMLDEIDRLLDVSYRIPCKSKQNPRRNSAALVHNACVMINRCKPPYETSVDLELSKLEGLALES